MLAESELWYESFQNWQSEFLSIAVLLVLGVYLRERGRWSPSPWLPAHGDRALRSFASRRSWEIPPSEP